MLIAAAMFAGAAPARGDTFAYVANLAGALSQYGGPGVGGLSPKNPAVVSSFAGPVAGAASPDGKSL